MNYMKNIIVPVPRNIVPQEGFFTFTPDTASAAGDEKYMEIKELLDVQLNLDTDGEKIQIFLTDRQNLGEEEYRINISQGMIELSASTEKGMFCAVQSLRQLYLSYGRSIPCCSIDDEPEYSYRGMMIDVARHFIPVDELLKLIDVASMHHINKFHWHLSDDQGWRIDIPGYPDLVRIGGERLTHNNNGQPDMKYGPYWYTEEDLKTVIEYCAARQIDVIPEIDVPGHVMSLLAAYPQYGCRSDVKFEVPCRWGIYPDVLCPGKPEVIDLMKDIFTYVASVFPSEWIHIGGDEVPKTEWEKCPLCRKKMEELGLDNVAQLQAWFSNEVAKIISSLGKTPIGWDEVLENTEKIELNKDIIVMSWRGSAGGIKGAQMGHDVIMCPNTNCYFDYRNNESMNEMGTFYRALTLHDVMDFRAADDSLTADEKKHIIGGQGNLWTEYVPFPVMAEHLLFPRLCYLAQQLWNRCDSDVLDKSLPYVRDRLSKLGIAYYPGN